MFYILPSRNKHFNWKDENSRLLKYNIIIAQRDAYSVKDFGF